MCESFRGTQKKCIDLLFMNLSLSQIYNSCLLFFYFIINIEIKLINFNEKFYFFLNRIKMLPFFLNQPALRSWLYLKFISS